MWPFNRGRRNPESPQAPVSMESAPGWASLPALQRIIGPLQRTFKGERFEQNLASHRKPAEFLAPLGHLISDEGPQGLINGIATPTTGTERAISPRSEPDRRVFPQRTVQRAVMPSAVPSPTSRQSVEPATEHHTEAQPGAVDDATESPTNVEASRDSEDVSVVSREAKPSQEPPPEGREPSLPSMEPPGVAAPDSGRRDQSAAPLLPAPISQRAPLLTSPPVTDVPVLQLRPVEPARPSLEVASPAKPNQAVERLTAPSPTESGDPIAPTESIASAATPPTGPASAFESREDNAIDASAEIQVERRIDPSPMERTEVDHLDESETTLPSANETSPTLGQRPEDRRPGLGPPLTEPSPPRVQRSTGLPPDAERSLQESVPLQRTPVESPVSPRMWGTALEGQLPSPSTPTTEPLPPSVQRSTGPPPGAERPFQASAPLQHTPTESNKTTIDPTSAPMESQNRRTLGLGPPLQRQPTADSVQGGRTESHPPSRRSANQSPVLEDFSGGFINAQRREAGFSSFESAGPAEGSSHVRPDGTLVAEAPSEPAEAVARFEAPTESKSGDLQVPPLPVQRVEERHIGVLAERPIASVQRIDGERPTPSVQRLDAASPVPTSSSLSLRSGTGEHTSTFNAPIGRTTKAISLSSDQASDDRTPEELVWSSTPEPRQFSGGGLFRASEGFQAAAISHPSASAPSPLVVSRMAVSAETASATEAPAELSAPTIHAVANVPVGSIQRAVEVGPPPAAEGASSDGNVDELANKLYDRIRSKLRAELRLDRERAGLVTDLRR